MELRIVESGKQGGGGAEYVAMFTTMMLLVCSRYVWKQEHADNMSGEVDVGGTALAFQRFSASSQKHV